MDLIVVLAAVVAVAAAVRSTWSPCGVSMLSAITPMSERGRGRRWGATASWFVVGATIGGATLGVGTAVLALVASWASASDAVALGIGAAGAVVAVATDARVPGVRLPRHTRQVDENWITRYRGWVCGLGFGWQIGVGLSTYIVTAAVYLMIVLGALSASPVAAIAVCSLFGLVRGLAILLGVRITNPEALVAFHRGFERAREPGRLATIAVLAAVALGAGAAAATSSSAVAVAIAGGALVLLLATLLAAVVARTGGRRRPAAGGLVSPS
jgi:hypothetical protein